MLHVLLAVPQLPTSGTALVRSWCGVQAIGVELDLTDKGLGVRSRRYAMLVDDGVVRLGCNINNLI